jgi:hypothetical protein
MKAQNTPAFVRFSKWTIHLPKPSEPGGTVGRSPLPPLPLGFVKNRRKTFSFKRPIGLILPALPNFQNYYGPVLQESHRKVSDHLSQLGVSLKLEFGLSMKCNGLLIRLWLIKFIILTLVLSSFCFSALASKSGKIKRNKCTLLLTCS